jgi:hypothetical protein
VIRVLDRVVMTRCARKTCDVCITPRSGHLGWPSARLAVLFAFDLIEHDGDDLRDLPLIERNRLRNLPSGVAWQKLAGRVVASTPRPFENGAKTRPSKRKP